LRFDSIKLKWGHNRKPVAGAARRPRRHPLKNPNFALMAQAMPGLCRSPPQLLI
jgi:hypothetical protein